MQDEQERPVHLIVDCSPPPPPSYDEDGNEIPRELPPRVRQIPLTDEEWAEHTHRAEAHAAAQAADAVEREQLAAQVAVHPDALVQLLARRAGLA